MLFLWIFGYYWPIGHSNTSIRVGGTHKIKRRINLSLYQFTSKTGRCQAQYLRSRRSTRRFFGFIQPLLIHLSALQVNSAQKVAKKHIFGNLILPNFSYFGTKNGPFGPPSVARTKIFGVMGVYSYGPITQ